MKKLLRRISIFLLLAFCASGFLMGCNPSAKEPYFHTDMQKIELEIGEKERVEFSAKNMVVSFHIENEDIAKLVDGNSFVQGIAAGQTKLIFENVNQEVLKEVEICVVEPPKQNDPNDESSAPNDDGKDEENNNGQDGNAGEDDKNASEDDQNPENPDKENKKDDEEGGNQGENHEDNNGEQSAPKPDEDVENDPSKDDNPDLSQDDNEKDDEKDDGQTNGDSGNDDDENPANPTEPELPERDLFAECVAVDISNGKIEGDKITLFSQKASHINLLTNGACPQVTGIKLVSAKIVCGDEETELDILDNHIVLKYFSAPYSLILEIEIVGVDSSGNETRQILQKTFSVVIEA